MSARALQPTTPLLMPNHPLDNDFNEAVRKDDARDLVARYKQLHEVYRRESKLLRPWTMECEYVWCQWERTSPEFTEENLILVLRWLLAEKKAGRIFSINHIRFENLIGQPEQFANHLGPALAAKEKEEQRQVKAKREYVDPGKAAVLEATHRPAEPERKPFNVKQHLKDFFSSL